MQDFKQCFCTVFPFMWLPQTVLPGLGVRRPPSAAWQADGLHCTVRFRSLSSPSSQLLHVTKPHEHNNSITNHWINVQYSTYIGPAGSSSTQAFRFLRIHWETGKERKSWDSLCIRITSTANGKWQTWLFIAFTQGHSVWRCKTLMELLLLDSRF